MVFVPASQIDAAYGEGRLRPQDVLLTDAIPAEIPPVAGIVSLTPATPNSHVALLAKSFGIPFVFLAHTNAQAQLRSWDGRDVLVRAVQQFLGCEVQVSTLSSPLDPQIREDILAFRAPPPLDIVPKQTMGALSLKVDDLGPADIRHVGGKAANLGVLRRSIPTNAPSPAIALTFDLWDAYLAQVLPGGGTLAAAVSNRLSGFHWPPEMGALRSALADVRELFTDDADFSADQRQAIIALIQDAGFDSQRNIRFRSSTNVEDSEQFSGAGLYDSFSGCLADDLDADSAGPSHCDPTEDNERGVFRALRKVYASFYNDNAFLERLRHGVDESIVGMGILVHHSTPDPIELANGVATLSIQRSPGNRAVNATLVTQVGAVSVSNPDSTAIPETAEVWQFSQDFEPSYELSRRSSLVPLGGTVLEWPKEYGALYKLLDAASLQWERELPAREQWLLDFEYKKVAPDGLLRIKQIRPLPLPPQGSPVTQWLLDSTNQWGVLQGEFGDLLAMHRLKSFWSLQIRHTTLVQSNLAETLFTRIDGTWMEGTNEVSVSSPVTSLPGHAYAHDGNTTSDSWDTTNGRRTLRINLERFTYPEEGPVAILGDFRMEFSARYPTPQPKPEFLFGGGIITTNVLEESVFLGPTRPVSAESLLQERTMGGGGREIRTTFYWPPAPKGAVAGYTAPLQAWVETTLDGFASRPITLRGAFSQTYHPGHHNFFEEFLFDPWLEPGVEADLLAELAAENIRGVIATRGEGGTPSIVLWGLDGTFRE
jgi:hypothetical protein